MDLEGIERDKWSAVCLGMTKSLPAILEISVQALGPEVLLRKWMATHFSILLENFKWTLEPDGLWSP